MEENENTFRENENFQKFPPDFHKPKKVYKYYSLNKKWTIAVQ